MERAQRMALQASFTTDFLFPAMKQNHEYFQIKDKQGHEFAINTTFIAYSSHDNPGLPITTDEFKALTAFLNFFRKISPEERFLMLNPYMEDRIHHATGFRYNLKERVTVTGTRDWICLIIGDLPFEKLTKIRSHYNISKIDVSYIFTYLNETESSVNKTDNRFLSITRQIL